MERILCDYCGLPFRTPGRPEPGVRAYCCSGCAMANALGIEGGKFPITAQLIFNLAFAFGVFNQGLLGLLGLALGREGRAGGAGLCLLCGIGLGALLYGAALFWQWRARWLRASDGFVFALAAGPLTGSLALAGPGHRGLGAMLSLAANLILALWLARGLFRRWWAGVRGISGATKR